MRQSPQFGKMGSYHIPADDTIFRTGPILRAFRDATIDRQVSEERLDFLFAHVLWMNPAPRAVVVKSQELLHPAAVRLDRPRGQPTHLAGRFILIEELHVTQFAAQELLGQFAPRENFRKSYVAKRLTLSVFRVFSTHSVQRITSSAFDDHVTQTI
jgi:hypothetical protein